MNYKNTLILVLLAGIFCFILPDKKVKQKINLNSSIKVINLTADKQLDTVINITSQILKIKNVLIIVAPLLPEEIETEYLGYIDRREGYYLIRIRPNLNEGLLEEIVFHEMWHCYQHESGRLKKLYYGFQFEGLTYTFNCFYFLRKFEIEAYENESKLKLLYKSYAHQHYVSGHFCCL